LVVYDGLVDDWLKWGRGVCCLKKYHARAVKGGDLRSSAYSAWVRIPLVLFLTHARNKTFAPFFHSLLHSPPALIENAEFQQGIRVICP
jgi:hypothetical protein